MEATKNIYNGFNQKPVLILVFFYADTVNRILQ